MLHDDGVALEDLASCDKLKLGDKGLQVYRMMMQHVARDDFGMSLARCQNATCFLRWIISVIPDAVIQACYQKATQNRALENRVSTLFLKVYQKARIERVDDSDQKLENHANIDETWRFSNKKIDSSIAVHCVIIEAKEHSKPSKRGEYQYVSGVMGISHNPF